MKSEVIIQIFSGGFSAKAVSYEYVEQKLVSVLPRLPVRKVIMGWQPDKALYEKTAAFLAKRNIDCYLWFPVFSETGMLRELSALTDFRGQEIKCRPNEDFSFCCPNNPQNIERILDIFEHEFASIRFSGVFLDRVRYPSFANGYESGQGFRNVFSCFCPQCLAVYEREKFNIELLKDALSRPFRTPLGITAYRDGGDYVFEDPVFSGFFALKAGIISESLGRICRYFRERNYSIGFDVFAPFLSPFVGQDLKVLSGLCDFIKPMMYRVTQAPAGLPFETEALLRQTNASVLQRQRFYELLGFNPANNLFDLTFTAKELQNLTASSSCPVYAGVEINKIDNIAETDPGYIEETIKGYSGTGIKGFVLSWNLLDAPEENIAKAAEVIERIQNV